MAHSPEELVLSLDLSLPSYDRLDALRFLTSHRGPGSMALRLIEHTLFEESPEVYIPPQPHMLSRSVRDVFLRLRDKTATAVTEGANNQDITPSGFALSVVEHSLMSFAAQVPAIDEIVSIRNQYRADIAAKRLPE